MNERQSHAMRRLGAGAVGVMLCATATPASAQFTLGSDGTYGDITLAPNSGVTTLDPPADGVFHCTTITIGGGATLRFTRNGLNTPIYLLATGDVLIEGTIDVSAVGRLGGPGGFDGGLAGLLGAGPSAGHGPGAGRPDATDPGWGAYSNAAFGNANPLHGAVYGSPLLVPLVGGSGGGGSDTTDGGGGGGAVLVGSDTLVTITGTLWANASAGVSYGSGGAVRVVAPFVDCRGSLTAYSTGGVNGSGRMRIDTFDRRGLAGCSFSPPASATVGGYVVVFPPSLPRLDLVEAAGQAIAVGTAAPVDIVLPIGTSPNQDVIVEGADFTGIIPISVVLTPDSGEPVEYQANLDMTGGSPAQVTVSVVFPVNVTTRVSAWTR